MSVHEAYVSGGLSLIGGERANRASAKEASRNRDFQRQQSNTAHQREIRDLKRAGLNPILSGIGGAGAATSAGSMAHQIDTLTPAVNTALESRRNYAEVKNMQEQNKLIREQTDKTVSEQALLSTQYNINLHETEKRGYESATAKNIYSLSNNELFSSNINRRIDAYKLEEARRATDRYGSSAKGLIDLLPKKGLKKLLQKNPYKVKPKPNYDDVVPY